MLDAYLFRSALRNVSRPRSLAATGFLVLLPALVALVSRYFMDEFHADAAFDRGMADLVFRFCLVLLAVIFSTSVLAQDIEQKTIVYLLTRPVPRWRLLLVKFVVAVLATTAASALSMVMLALATRGPAALPYSLMGRDLGVLAMGALTYGALFLLLACVFNRALLFGIIFAFGWEPWAPQLPGSFGRVSVMAYLQVLAPHVSSSAEDTALLPTAMAADPISHAAAWSTLAILAAIALAAALIVFSTGEYSPREDAE